MSGLADTLARLAAIDTCALSDALDKLGLAGQVTGLRRESGAGRVAGVAVTVKLGTGDPPPGPPTHLGCNAIEAADANTIIVVEQRTGVEAGCWGGLLTRGAIHAGVRAVVADGPVRDIDEARELGFAVFTNRLTCLTARARVVEKATNVPVEIGTVTVHPGDLIVADGSAVIVIRPEDADAVLTAAEGIVAREAAMIAEIARGTRMGAVLGGNYEHMLQKD
ncbi:RraA family protein [Sphingomonas canadensis]|uniref:Putative 4-hydroxy-4-methyl-2-oxoglutarate aldolase n=1 Tax=Sphingomonas canadensis TaxID=1219257 RepID=A0ABW3HAT4_9SPHN|nr:RraA family protein [Sphingomonas canadensis]MCW3838305.1 RraA family protein [Sphingomonas canadensis]